MTIHMNHGGGGDGRGGPAALRLAVGVLVVAAALTATAMILLWPRGTPQMSMPGGSDLPRISADVVSVTTQACPRGAPVPAGQPCGSLQLRLTSGPDNGSVVEADLPIGPGAPAVSVGDHLILVNTPGSLGGLDYQVVDHDRKQRLWLFALAAALVVVAFGRWRGLAAIGGLAVTFTILLTFIVPAILDGRSPLLVAIVGSAAIMLLVLYLTHGFNLPTSVAVLGTLASLTLTGLLAAAATSAMHLTGVASEEDGFLTVAFTGLNMQGLLLAGILIGSLGVLDDVAITQAATVTELSYANPGLTAVDLYRSAARVGRAHIASVVNTIVLAYAGASLPILLLLAAGDQALGDVLTTQRLSQEIVRSVVATLGLVAAVPITTALAAFAVRRLARPGTGDEGDEDEADQTSTRWPLPMTTTPPAETV